MPYPTSAQLFFSLLLLLPVAAEAREFAAWEEFDLPHPLCERAIPLAVGRESFFEIANEMPGTAEYNRLIRIYRQKKWPQLSAGIVEFYERFEKSPLREAVAFLDAESFFDRERGRDDAAEKDAERKLRSTLLLYPKSQFAPILSATAGAYWLRTRNYQRSLAIYELALENYPQHELSCTYKMGIAETHFLLRHWQEADGGFDRVLKDCANFRLGVAARIRKVDIAWSLDRPGIENAYETLARNESPFIERLYQPMLANLGEIKYRAGKWQEAAYYFDRYLKTERSESGCRAFAGKRLADVAFRSGEKTSQVLGRYLAVYSKSPKSDVGRFCHAHGLLADPELKAGPELERRIKLVDGEIDDIQDDNLRSRAYIEKGLTLLDLGVPDAMGFLEKIRTKTEFRILEGKTGDFIRRSVAKLLQDGKLAPLDSPTILTAIEKEHAGWLKGTPQAAWAVQFFADRVAAQVAALNADGKYKDALDRVAHWRKSPLWPAEGPDRNTLAKVGDSFLKSVYIGGKDGEASWAALQSRSVLEPILGAEYSVLFWLAGMQLNEEKARGGWVKWERDLASQSSQRPAGSVPLFRLASARGLRLQKDLEGAETALAGLDDPAWKEPILLERYELARAKGQGDKAYLLLKRAFEASPANRKKEFLNEMSNTIVDLKAWSHGKEMVDIARSQISDKEELGSYYHLAGRSLYELRRCKEAIEFFKSAFQMAPLSKQIAESRFRMAKCLASERDMDSAKVEWKKVVDMKDTFWSPLAQSELKLLNP